jgi:hypothetical protein
MNRFLPLAFLEKLSQMTSNSQLVNFPEISKKITPLSSSSYIMIESATFKKTIIQTPRLHLIRLPSPKTNLLLLLS